MPPKKKQSAAVLRKILKDKDAKMKALEAQLAAAQGANDTNKRGTSPTEQVQIAGNVKRARTKKGRKSGAGKVLDPLKDTKEMIATMIVDPCFATTKFCKGEKSREKLASHVLYYGNPDHGMTHAERDAWYKTFAQGCGMELNKHRSSVQTSIKREIRADYVSRTPHAMTPVARWEACLNRDLDPNNAEDLALFSTYYNQVMAKATGTSERWNTYHRGYFCLYNGHPPNKKALIDYYVTPETEAYALLVINGNHRRWTAQFQVTDKFPAYKQKPIYKWPDDEAIEASNEIKERLFREQNNVDELTDLPEHWKERMRLPFEPPILAQGCNAVSDFWPYFVYYLHIN